MPVEVIVVMGGLRVVLAYVKSIHMTEIWEGQAGLQGAC
jgi:hypothetical protein